MRTIVWTQHATRSTAFGGERGNNLIIIRQIIDWIKRLFGYSPKSSSEATDAQDAAAKYEETKRTNITAIFANKLTNIVRAQSTVTVTGVDGSKNKRADFINAAIQSVWKKSRKITAQAFGKGGKVIVPYIEDGAARFSVIDQHRMVINEISGGKITAATLVADVITRDKVNYYRLTDYRLENGQHRIINRAVNDSGTSIPLQNIPEWAGIAEEFAIANVDRLLLGFLKCPVDNRIDKDDYGVEITYGCSSLILEIIKHLEMIEREYKLSKSILGLDRSLWGRKKSALKDENGQSIPFGKTIEDVMITAQDSNSPFIPVDTADGEQPWLMFSPAIRDSAMYKRLEELFALLEKAVGTSRGILTERQSVGATATEIRAGQYDTFCIVDAMREQWDDVLDDLAYAYDVLAEYFGLTPAGARGAYKLSVDWDYSMYESSSETFQQLMELRADGELRKAELRQWVKGGTLEEAQAAIDDVKKFDGDSMSSLLGGGGGAV